MDRRNIVYRPREILTADLDINIKRAHYLMDDLYYASVYQPITLWEVWSSVQEIIGHMANCKRLCHALLMQELIAKEKAEKTEQQTVKTAEQKTDKDTVEGTVSVLTPINDSKEDNKPKRRRKQH